MFEVLPACSFAPNLSLAQDNLLLPFRCFSTFLSTFIFIARYNVQLLLCTGKICVSFPRAYCGH